MVIAHASRTLLVAEKKVSSNRERGIGNNFMHKKIPQDGSGQN